MCGRNAAIVLISLILLLPGAAVAGPRGGSLTWQRYYNKRWGFCTEYPRGWKTYEGFNKAGIAMSPGGRRWEITVGALPNQPRGLFDDRNPDDDTPMTLEENVNAYLYPGARLHARLLDKHATTLQKIPPIYTKIEDDNTAGKRWTKETVWALHDG